MSESHRRAGVDALAKILDLAAAKLGVEAAALRAVGGKIVGAGGKSLGWKEACSLIGMKPLDVTGDYKSGTKSPLSSVTVGGVQMAHVAVDRETIRLAFVSEFGFRMDPGVVRWPDRG